MDSLSLRSLFRGLVVGQLLLVVVAGIVDQMTIGQLPDALRTYVESQSEPSNALLIIGGILILATILLTVGMYRFSRLARFWYVAVWPVGVILAALMPPVVQTGIASALYSVGATVSGIIIALSYFSPVSREFDGKRPQVESTAAAV